MTTSIRTASRALATCALVLLLGSAPAAAAPILRGFDPAFVGTDTESWVEGILEIDVFMIVQVSSSEGELTGLGDWELVSFHPDANPFDDFFNLGEWTYSGDEQVAYYSLDKFLSISLWEPDTPNAGEINWFGPNHLTLWGITSPETSTGGDPEQLPAVPEPTAALLFALGFLGIERALRVRFARA
jgi:hypothetical protein